MTHEERIQIINRLLQELKDGKSEAEVKKEYEQYFSDPWTLSSTVVLPKAPTEKYDSYNDSENPLVIMAEENGATKALLHSLAIDINSEKKDEINLSLIREDIQRLCQISLHQRKMNEAFLPYMMLLGYEDKEELLEKEKEILNSVKGLNLKLKKEDPYLHKAEIVKLISLIQDQITYENTILLPALEDNLSPLDLYAIMKQNDEIGYFLINYRK